ncbi:hypothetical protein BAUCODRAFT_180153 [Baudoinia panamericana UAMH 10762]|uniref:AB hydrolase-1 domain-containing protein n=1 Tax=Baudoinia panamericana (strain UAMH 10762) TaxID=717646 RepID=M2MUS5_BAUPA|nr:uncharacterized protein BAUCODRAFT_180153 [Baudoinia panamericana UAMH 10762]EMD00692.1 hypothetical protein BAUCODRAFT_180153 [Baudoinia panamericana UAMH 10762]
MQNDTETRLAGAKECDSNARSLPFTSLNDNAKATILLIHGAFGDRHGWDKVTPSLIDYHLLLPDLPGHGEAAHLAFSNPLSAKLLSELIHRHAKGRRANVIGFSLGLHVAVELATLYPEVVNEIFISGLKMMPVSLAKGIGPYALLANSYLEDITPQWLISWLMDQPPDVDVHNRPRHRKTVAHCRAILEVITTADKGGQWPGPWPARTCIICAGKSGILPTADHPHDAVKLRDIGRKRNAEDVAFTHPLMRHPWCEQDPKLFADAARSWFEHQPLPIGFVEL